MTRTDVFVFLDAMAMAALSRIRSAPIGNPAEVLAATGLSRADLERSVALVGPKHGAVLAAALAATDLASLDASEPHATRLPNADDIINRATFVGDAELASAVERTVTQIN